MCRAALASEGGGSASELRSEMVPGASGRWGTRPASRGERLAGRAQEVVLLGKYGLVPTACM
jgi:hypothetical protein